MRGGCGSRTASPSCGAPPTTRPRPAGECAKLAPRWRTRQRLADRAHRGNRGDADVRGARRVGLASARSPLGSKPAGVGSVGQPGDRGIRTSPIARAPDVNRRNAHVSDRFPVAAVATSALADASIIGPRLNGYTSRSSSLARASRVSTHIWRTGGVGRYAGRDPIGHPLSFSRGHHGRGVVAACVRER